VLFVAIFFVAISAHGLATRTLPRWLIAIGLIGALASAVAMVAVIWRPATFVLPVSRLFLGAWIAGACLILGRERSRSS
jgi:hypothetical protein